MEKINYKILILVTLGAFLIVGLGFSLAYYTASISTTGSKVTTVTTGNIAMTLNLGDTVATDSLWEPGNSLTKTFSVKNTGNVDAYYTIYFSKLTNTFVTKSDLVYTITSSDGGYNTSSEVVVPSTESAIIDNYKIEAGKTHNYTLTVTFKETGVNQNDNQGKEFNATLTINEMLKAPAPLKDTILAAAGGTAAIEAKGAPTFSAVSTTDEGMYMAEDDYGKSYYYRGTVTNNNIIFGGFCWKIIRVNGNGTVRMIYNGTPTNNQCTNTTGESTQIGTSKFNSGWSSNAYVGYMYGTAGSSTYAAEHANTNSSTIKKDVIDPWYEENIANNANYADKISDTLFCNDRSIASSWSSGMWNSNDTALGYGTNYTYYGYYSRSNYSDNTASTKNQVTFKCANKNDRFTVSDTTTGNGALTNPIALITADEVNAAGGLNANNSSYYLYTGQYYWSLSPDDFGFYGNARVFRVGSSGFLGSDGVISSRGVRPVISLKADTLVSQDGTGESTNPYIVS